MPKSPSAKTTPYGKYLKARIQSTAFKQDLTALLEAELHSLSREKVKDVIDAKRVRRLIEQWDMATINHRVVADLAIEATRLIAQQMKAKKTSARELLDRKLVAGIEALLHEDVVLSEHAEELIARIMQQELVQNLFTDIIHTSIVSFYKRVNPVFGGLAMMVLEEQIKGFIRLFMPMVQQHATAFVINKDNQAIFSGFSRWIIRELLNEPLPHLFGFVSPRRGRKASSLIKLSIGNAALQSLIRETAVAVWDGLYPQFRNKRVGDLILLEHNARWLAEQAAGVMVPALSRPRVLKFVEQELALVGAAPGRRRENVR